MIRCVHLKGKWKTETTRRHKNCQSNAKAKNIYRKQMFISKLQPCVTQEYSYLETLSVVFTVYEIHLSKRNLSINQDDVNNENWRQSAKLPLTSTISCISFTRNYCLLQYLVLQWSCSTMLFNIYNSLNTIHVDLYDKTL